MTSGPGPGILWRASVLTLMILAWAPGASALAQAPQAAPTPPDPLTFSTDRMLVIFQIAEATGTDFEVVMGKVKDVLAQSTKPERRQQAAHWRLLKVDTPQNGVLTYFFVLDQVVKGVSYDPFKILSEGLPAEEVGVLFEKIKPGLKGISAAPLGFIVNMGGGGL